MHFRQTKTLLEFCHLKLTTKIINLQTKTLCSIRQIVKNNFWQPFEREPCPRNELEKISLANFSEIMGVLQLTLTSTAPPDGGHLYIENLSILKLNVKRAPELSI